MRIGHGLGELTQHVQPRLDTQAVAVQLEIRVQPHIRLAVGEQDRRPALVLADLHGLGDAAVAGALQNLVLAPRRTLDRMALLLTRLVFGEIDPHPALLTDDVVASGQPVLPGRARIEQFGGEAPVVAEPQMGCRGADADLLQQLRQDVSGELRADPLVLPLRRHGQEILPDLRQAGAGVAGVDAGALHLVQRGLQIRRREEHGGFDARYPVADV